MDQVMLIPTTLFKKIMKLSEELEFVKKEVKSAVKIPKSQAWFWTKDWQAKERAADKAIKEGKVRTFSSAEELIENLHR